MEGESAGGKRRIRNSASLIAGFSITSQCSSLALRVCLTPGSSSVFPSRSSFGWLITDVLCVCETLPFPWKFGLQMLALALRYPNVQGAAGDYEWIFVPPLDFGAHQVFCSLNTAQSRFTVSLLQSISILLVRFQHTVPWWLLFKLPNSPQHLGLPM